MLSRVETQLYVTGRAARRRSGVVIWVRTQDAEERDGCDSVVDEQREGAEHFENCRLNSYTSSTDSSIALKRSSCPCIVQELCESRGGRPGLSVLTSLLVSVDVKNY